MKRSLLTVLTLGLLLTAGAAGAEIFVSANDGKQARPDDVMAREPDSVSVIDVANGKVKLLATIAVGGTLVGPPTSVALTRDSRLAIVSSAQKRDGAQVVLNDQVAVIDLSNPRNPRVVQTVQAGPGASGLSISPDGKLVLVASTGDDGVTAFTLANRRLTRVGHVTLEKGSGPSDIIFRKDGKSALAVGRMNSKFMIVSVNGTQIADTGKSFTSGREPYNGAVTPDGKYLINVNLGGVLAPGAAPPVTAPSSVALVELATGRVAAQAVTNGPTSEVVALSANGRIAAVVLQNGSAPLIRTSPNFASQSGILEIYTVGDGTLTKVTQAPIGHWPQGAAISADGRTILVQNAYERTIQVFHLNGNTLTADPAATIQLGARPASIATARSR